MAEDNIVIQASSSTLDDSNIVSEPNDNIQADYMVCLPNEVLLDLFSYLKPKHLVKCREVCWRWKNIVDSMFRSEVLWRKHCKSDFIDIYKSAYYKAHPELTWNNLYRSLTLWSKLQHATEFHDEFAAASCSRNEIRDFQLLKHGQLGVHTREGIIYYDIKTLNQSNRKSISGDYLRYYENDEIVIVLELTAHLHVIRKVLKTPRHMAEAWFPSVMNFLIHDDLLYYVTTKNNIFICNMSNEMIQSSLLIHMEDGIMCMGHKNGYLNVLTYLRNIFTVVDEVNVFRHTLDDSQNLFHELVKYNLLDNLDWRVFFLWLFILNRTIPHNSIRNIIVAKVYGDVVFVGSLLGIFRIYCSPYLNNEFDIFNTEPVKQYNFMERSDCTVLTDSPIIQIDVIEGEDCHTVLVGMPKKIAVIKFTHDTKFCPSKIDLGDLQIIEVNDTL